MIPKLHDYQNFCVKWILDKPYSGIFLTMGLGKTLITLEALSYLRDLYGENHKILVIAPKTVADSTWPSEIEQWDDIDFTYSKVLGSTKKREAALDVNADIYLINPENVVWLTEYYKKAWPFKTVVIDELSKFKSNAAKRFKALAKVRPLIDRVIGLTGTPSPNGLMDLWPQVYLLDQGKRLQKSITRYRSTYFYPAKRFSNFSVKWELIDGAQQMIYDKIGDICVGMDSKDYLKLPECTYTKCEVQLNTKERKTYETLKKDLVLELDNDNEIVAANPAVLAGKLVQLANGAIYDEDKRVIPIHERKLDALEELVEQANGQSVLIFYYYQHDLARIKKRFPDAQEFDKDNADKTVKEWTAGKIEILLAHPASIGYGLNLQHGGHIIIWYGLTWSLEQYQQANKRIDRQGQKEPVSIFHIIAKNTIDEQIMDSLEHKKLGQEQLMKAIKANL